MVERKNRVLLNYVSQTKQFKTKLMQNQEIQVNSSRLQYVWLDIP
jgi:hypothetical protein